MGQGATNYGYGSQQQMNSNYGGRPPQQSSYGYSGANAYGQGSSSRYGTGAMVGAVVAGAVVGAGAMYMYHRMNTYSPRMQQRLVRAGARSSDLTISLLWDTTDNLDLEVLPPAGPEINAQNRGNSMSASGGWLDTDANNGMIGTNDPVENCMFDQPLQGRYEVRVRFDDCTGFCGDNIEYQVVVRAAVTLAEQNFQEGVQVLDQSEYGTILAYNGVMSHSGQTDGVMSFTVSNVPAREWCVAPATTVRAGDLMDCSECRLLVAGGAASWAPAAPAPSPPPSISRDVTPAPAPAPTIDPALVMDPSLGPSSGPSSGPARSLQSSASGSACVRCTGAQCDVPLPAAMSRDDIMSAMVVPARFTPPLTVSVTSLSSDRIPRGICDIPPTSSVQMMLSLTQLDSLPGPDGEPSCDQFLNVPCTAQTDTGCYNNELCTGVSATGDRICECEPESCLEGNECHISGADVGDSGSSTSTVVSAAITLTGGALWSKIAALVFCSVLAMLQ